MRKILLLLNLLFILGQTVNAQTWQWAEKAAGSSSIGKGKINVDANGSVFFAGVFRDSIQLGTTTLVAAGTSAVYLAKYDAGGSLQWATIAARDSAINVGGIHVDAFGRVDIVGQYFLQATFGSANNDTLISTGDYDVFLARYDSSGNLLWSVSLGDTGYDFGSGVCADDHGNTYITGEFHFSSFPFSGSKIIIACYDSLGNSKWLKMPSSFSSTDIAEEIKTDSAGNSYVTGQFFGTLTFDSVTILNAGNIEANTYIGKFDANGDNLWLQKAGAASGYCAGFGIDVDPIGNSYITGVFHGTISLGTLSLSSSFGVANEIFIAKVDSGGNYVWAVKPNGVGQGRDISVNNSGACFIYGQFTDSLNAGATHLSNPGSNNIFIIRADTSGNFQWATQLGNNNAGAGGIRSRSQGIYVSGNFADTLDFDGSFMLQSSGGLYDAFLARLDINTDVHPLFGKSDIKIFPNPVTSFSKIEFDLVNAETVHIFITDVLGKKLADVTNKIYPSGRNVLSIPAEKLSPGIYILHIEAGAIRRSVKFVFQE